MAITTLELGSSTDVLFMGDGDVDLLEYSVDSSGRLQHNLGGSFGFNSNVDLDAVMAGDQTLLLSDLTSLTFVDSGSNDRVTFSAGSSFAFDAANLEVSAGDIVVGNNTVVSSTGGAIHLIASRSILLDTGSTLSTVDGGIKLDANVAGNASGLVNSLIARGRLIETTGTGTIELTGVGGTSGGDGVDLGATIRSTSAASGAGAIHVVGTGGGSVGTNGGRGVYVYSPNITSNVGDILISGQGAASSSNGNFGVYISSVDEISSTGTDIDAAKITIIGVGGGVAPSVTNTGIDIRGTTTDIRSAYGDISLQGTGGAGSRGVALQSMGVIASTGRSDGAATISINGTGGDASSGGQLMGVYALGAQLTSIDGAISIEGQGGTSDTGSGNFGVQLRDGVTVSSTGAGLSAASLHITGNGGVGTDDQHGVNISGAVITSADGAIEVSGRGGTGSGRNQHGVVLNNGSTIASTGAGLDVSGVNITGYGGIGVTGASQGVVITTNIDAVDGLIAIRGVGGQGAGSDAGIVVAATLSSTGVGDLARGISLNGDGGSGDGSHGVDLTGNRLVLTAVHGDIVVNGLAGNGNDAAGIYLKEAGIASTGISDRAAKITLTGRGGDGRFNTGVRIQNASQEITSIDGDIKINGFGGATGTTGRYGIYSPYHRISSTGTGLEAARIRLNGVGEDANGVYFPLNTSIISKLSSVDGEISITGSSSGDSNVGVSIGDNNEIISTGVGLDAASVSITGTGGLGVSLSGPGSRINSTSGPIVVDGNGKTGVQLWSPIKSTGRGADAATITIIGHATTNNSVDIEKLTEADTLSSIDGDIQVVGYGGSGIDVRAAITSSGLGLDAAAIEFNGTAGDGTIGKNGVYLHESLITSLDGDVSMVGRAGNGDGIGVFIGSTSRVQVASGAISVNGSAYTGNSTGVFIGSSALESTATSSISILATGAGTGTDFVAGNTILGGSTATGHISVEANSIELTTGLTLQSTGDLTIRPRTSGTTIGLGGGVGTLNLDDLELSYLADGFQSITIGDRQRASVLDTDTVTFSDPVVLAASTIRDHTGLDIDAGENSVTLNGNITPGQSPGVLQVSGGLKFADPANLAIEIGGPTPGETAANHDQLDVTGSVSLGNNTFLQLSLINGYMPVVGDQYVIINNDGVDPILGTFVGMPEGTLITNFLGSGRYARVSYRGIDGLTGNDMVLTIVPDPLVVTSTDDTDNLFDDVTTLREAINYANAKLGLDSIRFNLPGAGPHTIQPLAPLPAIIERVNIDGYTQPGAIRNTFSVGSNANLLIELDGSLAGASDVNGLTIASAGGGSTITGLVINRFSGAGIEIQANANVLQGNFIGVDVTGTQSHGNRHGIEISGGSGNRIGNGAASARNLISGNNNVGIRVLFGTSSANYIQNNYIGLDASGTASLPNRAGGVVLQSGAHHNLIGGTTPSLRNVIAGNVSAGITLSTLTTHNEVQGNFIGTDANGAQLLDGASPIQAAGVSMLYESSTLNTIGGSTPSAGNLISSNGYGILISLGAIDNTVSNNTIVSNLQQGLEIVGGTDNTISENAIANNQQEGIRIADGHGNLLTKNRISDNGYLGIDLLPFGVNPNDDGDADDGPNALQNTPVLTAVSAAPSPTMVQGVLSSTPNTTFRLEFFANSTSDSTAYGEGETYLGEASVTTDAVGTAEFAVVLPRAISGGQFVSATATDPDGNTSEFSHTLVANSNNAPQITSYELLTAPFVEGDRVTVHGAFADLDSDDTHTIRAIWGDDSGTTEFTLPVGQRTFELTHRYQYDSSDQPSGVFSLEFQLSDDHGAFTKRLTPLSIDNGAPSISHQEDESLTDYDWVAFSREVTFSDPGQLDEHTVTVDYGDGSATEAIAIPLGERSVTLVHYYGVTPGQTVSHTVSFQLADDDTSTSTQFDVTVVDLALTQPDVRPYVEFIASSFEASEGAGPNTLIEAVLSTPATELIEVPTFVTSGTAEWNADFFLNSTTFVFQPGQSRSALTLSVIEDDVDEGIVESATISMSSMLSGVKLGSFTTAQIDILDNDDPPAVYFSELSSTLKEGDDYLLKIEMTAASTRPVIVPLVVTASSEKATDSNVGTLSFATAATSTPQYILESSTVTIPAGSRAVSTLLSIPDDSLPEGAETIRIDFGADIVGAEIRDEPGLTTYHLVQVEASDVIGVSLITSTSKISEAAGSLLITARLDTVASQDYTVPVTITSDTAGESDFVAIDHITIPAGQIAGSGTVRILDDEEAETDEPLTVDFGTLPGGLVPLSNWTSVTIKDDDQAVIEFDASVSSAYEDAGTQTLTITTGGVTFADDVTISIAVKALSGSVSNVPNDGDITVSAHSVTIPSGETTGTFSFQVNNDTLNPRNEPTEKFAFYVASLSGIPHATLGSKTTHIFSLLDDDPLVSISTATISQEEAKVIVPFTVSLSAPSNKTVRVYWSTFGTATLGTDYSVTLEKKPGYEVAKNYLYIYPGTTKATIRVNVLEDGVSESAENVGIQLVAGTATQNALISRYNWASFEIANDDPVPNITTLRAKEPGTDTFVKSSWVNEGGDFRVGISLANVVNQDVYVPISFPTAAGRADASDFTTGGLNPEALLKIPANKRTAYFTIHIKDDIDPEDQEKLRIQMGPPQDSNGDKIGYLPSKTYAIAGIYASDQYTCSTATALTLALCSDETAPINSPDSSTFTVVNVTEPTIGVGTLALASGGYRRGSYAFIDANFNGVRDYLDFNADGIQSDGEPNEPSAETRADGSLVIFLPFELDRNENGVLDLDEGQLVVVGGIDTSIGIPQVARLVAPAGDYVATPLTTLAAKLIRQHGGGLADAHERILDSLSLARFDLSLTPVLHATVAGDFAAAGSYPSTVALENIAVVLANYIRGVAGIGSELAADFVYDELAQVIASPDVSLDLGDQHTLAALLNGVLSRFGAGATNAAAMALTGGLAAVNRELLLLPVSTELDFLNAIIKRKVVARGAMSSDALALASGTLSPDEFYSMYSGAALADRVAAAVPGEILPPAFAIADASVLEGNQGTSYAEFAVQVTPYRQEAVSVDFAARSESANDDPLRGALDFTPLSGRLTWQPGDDPIQLIRIPIYGDTLSELDETFTVELSNPTSGVIRRALATGTIRADDTVNVQIDATDNHSDVVVEFDDQHLVTVYQDGTPVLDGQLDSVAPLTIQAAADGSIGFHVNLLTALDVTRAVTIIAGNSSGELHFDDTLAAASTHELFDEGDGQFVANGLTLAYENFADVSSARSPRMSVDGTAEIGSTLHLEATLPNEVDTTEAVGTWIVTHLGDELITAKGDVLDFVPTASGPHEIIWHVSLADGSISEVRRTVNIATRDPVPRIVEISTPRIEGTAIDLLGTVTDEANLDDNLSFAWNVYHIASDQTRAEVATGAGRAWSFLPADDGNYEILLIVTNERSGQGTAAEIIEVQNASPVILALNGPIDPVAVENEIQVVATFFDPGSQDTHIAEWDWGDGTSSPGSLASGAEPASVSGAHAYVNAGVYTISLKLQDNGDGQTSTVYEYAVVYDPSAGFITGGGWIDSPLGAWTADPAMTGRATFGFVSKYRNGASVPEGQTQFRFQSAAFEFFSESYEWLVIAGASGKFKGHGTINGMGDYGFLITATDGQMKSPRSVDSFRIKVWDSVNEAVIYDNQSGELNDAYDGTELGGGNIVIHAVKSRTVAAVAAAAAVVGALGGRDVDSVMATLDVATKEVLQNPPHVARLSQLRHHAVAWDTEDPWGQRIDKYLTKFDVKHPTTDLFSELILPQYDRLEVPSRTRFRLLP
ncbi:MAG: right-handed parallel beta-helix repeat-containing protein [Planctomycetales bacterium]|nr:right-handed parallel beta-helix repeat-containing protein [Planctomycetales bacterium]